MQETGKTAGAQALELRNITKRFGIVIANDRVSMGAARPLS